MDKPTSKELILQGYSDTSDRVEVDYKKIDKNNTMVILALGQGNAANSAETEYTPKHRVFNIFNGKCYKAKDPLLGATATALEKGSVWTRLADKIIESDMYKNVIIKSIAVAGTPITCWTVNGKGAGWKGIVQGNYHSRILDAHKELKSLGFDITHIFWHQGETDTMNKTTTLEYKECFLNMLDSMRKNGIKAPIYMALASRYNFDTSKEVISAQKQLIQENKDILQGPNTDLINRFEDRIQYGSRFSKIGVEKHANAWFEAIKKNEEKGKNEKESMITISKIWYPDKNKLIKYIDKIYESGWLTNNGPLVQELEKRLEKYLGVRNLVCVANGFIALQMAYKLLELKDEVITTPFSFVATTESILEEGLTPVFSDIDKEYFTLDPKKIKDSVTNKTTGIVPVHVFGNACKVEEIVDVAKENNLKIVFDGSHAFGVKYNNQSVLNYGDISTLSFNAVKLFHSVEGGALIIKDDKLYEKAKKMRQYGHTTTDGANSFSGINGKMNELEAAMGLCVLDDIEEIVKERMKSYLYYEKHLKEHVQMLRKNEKATFNYSYCPVVFRTVEEMKKVQEELMSNNIKSRRYFAPSLDTLSYLPKSKEMTISRGIADKVLSLPLHSGAEVKAVEIILKTLQEVRKV